MGRVHGDVTAFPKIFTSHHSIIPIT